MGFLKWSNGTGQQLAAHFADLLLNPSADLKRFLTVRCLENGAFRSPTDLQLKKIETVNEWGQLKSECTTGETWEAREVRVTFQTKDDHKTKAKNDHTKEDYYHLVIMATGMGEERTWTQRGAYVDGYWGPRFWDHDDSLVAQLGCEKSPRVLISGGGDGALQDFLRIATGKEPYDLIKAIEQAVGMIPAWREQCDRIWQAEESERRTRHWGGNSINDQDQRLHQLAQDFAATQLHRVHEQAIEDIYKNKKLWEQISKMIEEWTKDRYLEQLHLVYLGTVPIGCYTLNRFLMMLVSKHLGNKITMIPGNKIVSVQCIDHQFPHYDDYRLTPLPSKHPCWGKPHKVRFEKPLALKAQNPVSETDEMTYDIVILRHGIEGPEENHYDQNSHHNPYQLLPYQPDSSYWQAYTQRKNEELKKD